MYVWFIQKASLTASMRKAVIVLALMVMMLQIVTTPAVAKQQSGGQTSPVTQQGSVSPPPTTNNSNGGDDTPNGGGDGSATNQQSTPPSNGVGIIADPLKDESKGNVGIITDPVGDPGHNTLKDQGIKSCDLRPSGCESGTDPVNDPDHNTLKDQGIRQCDLTPPGCQNTEDSPEDHGHNLGVHPDTDDPNNPVQEEPSKEKGSEHEDVQDGKIFEGIIPTDKQKDSALEANTAPDVYGCPFDYEYNEEFDICAPTADDFAFAPVLAGDKPLPDSVGGYVGLAGGFVQDSAIAVGVGVLQIGLGHYVGDTLVDFGDGGGPIGWGIQGLGYTIGFTADAAGVLVEGAGQVVGAVAEGAGDIIDGVGSAAEDAWDEVSSWF